MRPVEHALLPEFPHHREQLTRESGISEKVVSERGYTTVKSKAELGRLGFAGYQQLAPALLVPMYSPTRERTGCQAKPDSPRQDKRTGRIVKYETPAGSEIRLDVHPSQADRMQDTSVPLWITEGVKKADSLVSHGLCAVALQGVDCWQRSGIPLPEWEEIRLYGRQVAVVFDSDVSVKPEVQRALEGLYAFLKSRGASVRVVYLPGPEKGIDDYLVAGGTVKKLAAYAEEGLREDLSEVGRLLADVQPEPVEWLWPRRIPKGKITVLDGDPDNGKSVLTTDLAARKRPGGISRTGPRQRQPEP